MRVRWVEFGLVVGLVVAVGLGLVAGHTWVSPVGVWGALVEGRGPDYFLVVELRLPRVLAAVLVGAGLAAAGAVCQSVLRNPLASPDIVGVTAGASAAVVTVVVGGAGAAGQFWGVTGLAVVGGLVAGAVVLGLSWSSDPVVGLPGTRVVLVGLGVNALGLAVTSWLLFRADLPDVAVATRWLAGSLGSVSLGVLGPLAVVLGLGLVVLWGLGRLLGLLRLDPLSVWARGVRPVRVQVGFLVVAAVLAAAATAVTGPVAFVAFVAPQVAMRLCGSAGPVPLSSAVVGALLLVLADVVARSVFPFVLPVGLVTAICGAPFLVWLLVRVGRSAGSV